MFHLIKALVAHNHISLLTYAKSVLRCSSHGEQEILRTSAFIFGTFCSRGRKSASLHLSRFIMAKQSLLDFSFCSRFIDEKRSSVIVLQESFGEPIFTVGISNFRGGKNSISHRLLFHYCFILLIGCSLDNALCNCLSRLMVYTTYTWMLGNFSLFL